MNIAKLVIEKVNWIKKVLKEANANGVVLGMSGGKDSALVGILAKMATDNVTGIIMPCQAKRNFYEDREHAILLNDKYGIKTLEVDLTSIKEAFSNLLEPLDFSQLPMAYANINPRLRMITLYNYAQRKGYLVAGTGNLSEMTMGYFTKWGDGAFDFNPIADMTATEVLEMLRYLDCPKEIIDKPPSAALFEGQTDEEDMGIKYVDLDRYIKTGQGSLETKEKVERAKRLTEHKRKMGRIYPD
ncbi:MAG: NAD(+) synthase [Clostridiales bacterium]|mgnify:CR=1 FL=1|nr:NAD(+) synthase [Clostridiales bacterium]